MKFIIKYNLSLESTPVDWFYVFLNNSRLKNEKYSYSTNNYYINLNMKEFLKNYVEGNSSYSYFTIFSTIDIEKHLEFYFL